MGRFLSLVVLLLFLPLSSYAYDWVVWNGQVFSDLGAASAEAMAECGTPTCVVTPGAVIGDCSSGNYHCDVIAGSVTYTDNCCGDHSTIFYGATCIHPYTFSAPTSCVVAPCTNGQIVSGGVAQGSPEGCYNQCVVDAELYYNGTAQYVYMETGASCTTDTPGIDDGSCCTGSGGTGGGGSTGGSGDGSGGSGGTGSGGTGSGGSGGTGGTGDGSGGDGSGDGSGGTGGGGSGSGGSGDGGSGSGDGSGGSGSSGSGGDGSCDPSTDPNSDGCDGSFTPAGGFTFPTLTDVPSFQGSVESFNTTIAAGPIGLSLANLSAGVPTGGTVPSSTFSAFNQTYTITPPQPVIDAIRSPLQLVMICVWSLCAIFLFFKA